MSRENCLPYQENLAAYGLGSVDAEELAAFESHLNDCHDCQAELAGYRKIAIGLLNSVPQQTPSLSLRRKLAGHLPSAQKRTSGLFAASFKQFATFAILVVLLGLNLFSVMQIRKLQEQQKVLAERLLIEQSTIGMLAHPDTQLLSISADVPDMNGSILLDKEKNTAVLVLWNLPELEAGQIYQIWLVNANGDRISGGLFNPSNEMDYTTASIRSSLPIGEFIAIGVTIEPSGGSDQPTGSRVLVVEL